MNMHLTNITRSILVICFLLYGCSGTKTLTIKPQVLNGQHLVIQDSVDAIFSPKKVLVTVRVGSHTYLSEGRPTFVVTVANSKTEPFEFSTESIQVFVDGKPHKVLTYDELVEDVKSQQPLVDNNRTDQFISVLDATVLQKKTVFPRSWHSGYITIEKIPDPGDPHDIKVLISIAEEEHEFLFRHVREKR